MDNVPGAFAVRVAGQADLSAVLRVLSLARSHGSALRYPSDRQRQTWARMMQTDDLTVYLGEIDGEPAATAALLVMPHLTYECAPTTFIEAVAVVPEPPAQGIRGRRGAACAARRPRAWVQQGPAPLSQAARC